MTQTICLCCIKGGKTKIISCPKLCVKSQLFSDKIWIRSISFSREHINGVQKPFSFQILLFHTIPIQISLILFLASQIFLFSVVSQYCSFFCLLIFKPRSLQGTSWSFSGCHDATNFVCGRFLGKKLFQKQIQDSPILSFNWSKGGVPIIKMEI